MAAVALACLLVAVHFAVLAASLNDYHVSVDSGYHVAMARWYAEHGTAFWDHVNYAPAGRPNLQGPALHVAIALTGRMLGGQPYDYVLANALLALLQWAAAVGTAMYFARRHAGDWAALFAAALLCGNAFASYSFAVGIPSGWTFILAPWTIHFFLERRLVACGAATTLIIYSHLAGYATAPVGVVVAALLTRRWRDLILVGAGVMVATAPYTIHVVRHLEWLRSTRGQAARGLAPLLYLLALLPAPGIIRNPRANAFWIAWAMEPAAWLLQNHLRYLGQVTLVCAALGGLGIAGVMTRVPRRLRPILVAAVLLLATVPSRFNDASLPGNLRWLAGARYPRHVDWSEASELGSVLRREHLSNRVVSTYNATHCIAVGVFAPLKLEKGHWVEVRPRRDPAEQLSAGGKAYILPLPPDDELLRQLEQRGLVRVHGGSATTSVATLSAAAPALDIVLPIVRESLPRQAQWIAEHAVNNVWRPADVPLAEWRDGLLRQRTAAGRLQLGTVLSAYALESSDPAAAASLRGAARGAGSLAYFLGDEGAAGFVSHARHARMQARAGTLATTLSGLDGSPDRLRPVILEFRTMFEDYFAID